MKQTLNSLPDLVQQLVPGNIQRHRHSLGYATVVFDGSYEEIGDAGRKRLRGGDAIVHGAFEAHRDSVHSGGAFVINLPVAELNTGFYHLEELELLLRLVRSGQLGLAASLLSASAKSVRGDFDSWEDVLASDIERDPWICLEDWASQHGLNAWNVSKRFFRVYGLSPKQYRAESKARRALNMIEASSVELSQVAVDSGFCDQAHMSRAILDLTGRTAGAWRRSLSLQTKSNAGAL